MIKKKYLDVDVITAARKRIKKIFENGLPVALSYSAGKDSLVLADIVLKMVQAGEIDKDQLKVIFVDEEGVYDDAIEHAKKWRKKFLMEGVRFEWYCMEFVHFNALNTLSDDMSFITWDRFKKKNWLRPMPDFAITEHYLHIPRKDTYQVWRDRVSKHEGELVMLGVRAAESVQRLKALSTLKTAASEGFRFFPIYDTTDKDIWSYIYKNDLDFPETYKHLYQVGTAKNQLRMSQFFAIDTVRSLVKLKEFKPDLMDRIEKREPNAYLVALYWDSSMFKRNSKKRRENEKLSKSEQVSYRNKFYELIHNPNQLERADQKKLLRDYKSLAVRYSHLMDEKVYRQMVESVLAGDPKKRQYRAIYTGILSKTRRGG